MYTLPINPFKYEAQTALFKDPVRTALETTKSERTYGGVGEKENLWFA